MLRWLGGWRGEEKFQRGRVSKFQFANEFASYLAGAPQLLSGRSLAPLEKTRGFGMTATVGWELPDLPLVLHASMGSFDCEKVRACARTFSSLRMTVRIRPWAGERLFPQPLTVTERF